MSAPDSWLIEARDGSALPGQSLPWLRAVRAEAQAAFAATGLPGLRDEEWKYTSVAQIEKEHFSFHRPASADFSADAMAAWHLADMQRLVFVDGRYMPGLSSGSDMPAGSVLASVAELLGCEPGRLQAWLGSVPWTPPGTRPSGFSFLNTACMADGAYLHLAAGTRLAAPLHLLFIASAPHLATHTRNLVIAEADSHACIVEHHVSLGPAAPTLTNVATDIVLGRNAVVEHHKLQEEGPKAFHIAALRVRQGPASRFVSSAFALGGKLARTDIAVALDAEEASCTLDGLYLADGRQHTDQHTRIDHLRPRCTSRQLYKGVVGGGARAVFNGKLVVHADAQRSDAAQTNRNLLLSAHAEIDTKPQLEIWADDVQCSHGATVAQLDAEQLFYLRSRGLADATARALLIYGFVAEMVERIAPPALRARLEVLLRARLPQASEAAA